MIMNESGDGTAMDITLNNYRVNKDEIIFDNKFGLTWTGEFFHRDRLQLMENYQYINIWMSTMW